MANQLTPPPRFGNEGQAPESGPQWLIFVRWLKQLFVRVNAAASVPDVSSLQRPAPMNFGPTPGTLNAALLLTGARQNYVDRTERSNALLDKVTKAPTAFNPALETANLAILLALAARTSQGGNHGAGLVLEDTHANRLANYPANNYAIGTLFYETDRTVLYLNAGTSGSQKWIYIAGVCACTQAALPNDLGANDGNFLANVFDYGHMLIWSGVAWTWGPGDGGSGMLQLFEVDPTGAGWHLYDGSTVSYLKADGTLGSKTLPNLSGGAPTRCYLKTSDTNAGPTAPTAPTFTGTGTGALTFTGTPATLTGSVSAPVFTGTPLGVHSHTSPVGIKNSTTAILTGDFGAGTTQNIADTFTIAASAGTQAFLATDRKSTRLNSSHSSPSRMPSSA